MLLRDWTVSVFNKYCPPEARGLPSVGGILQQDRPPYKKGQFIFSSPIVKIEGRKFTTQTGSVYELDGEPHPTWLKEMEKAGNEVDLQNPLKDYCKPSAEQVKTKPSRKSKKKRQA